MKTRISTFFLLRNAWGVFKSKPQMMIFPLLNMLIVIAIVIGFYATSYYAAGGDFDRMQDNFQNIQPGMLGILLVTYLLISFATIFINTAMVAFFMRHFDYGDATIGYGFREALARIGNILKWSLLTCTVGVVLNIIGERFQLVGKIVEIIFGMAWALGTYFIIPVMVYENMGPRDALKKSAALFFDTWGKQLTFIIGMGFVEIMVVLLSIVACFFIAFGLSNLYPNYAGIIFLTTFTLWFLLFIMLLLISNCFAIIFKNLLYRYATDRSLPESFNREKIESVVQRTTTP